MSDISTCSLNNLFSNKFNIAKRTAIACLYTTLNYKVSRDIYGDITLKIKYCKNGNGYEKSVGEIGDWQY